MIKNFIKLLTFILPVMLLAQSPGGVSSPVVWYRADALVYSNAGTTPASNNVAVYQWNDFLGTGRNLLQPTAGNRPIYSNLTTLANFNPTVTFTRGSTNWMQCDPGVGNEIINRASGTFYSAGFMDFDFLGTSLGAGLIGFHTDMDFPGLHTSNNTQFKLLMFSNSSPDYLTISTNPFAYKNSFVSGASWQNGASITNPTLYGATTLSLNGMQTFYSGNNFGNVNTNNAYRIFRIGGDTNWGSHNGQLNEILIYQNILTPAETNRLESYLAIKYGTTLLGNYVNSGNTIVWNTSAAYQNNVFGIARDDNGALYQKQSRSENRNQKLIIGAGNSLAATNAANTNTLTDGQFLLVGDNNLAQSLTTPLAYTGGSNGAVNFRFASIWKVKNTNGVGQVTVAWPKGIKNLYLVQSTDENFTGGDTFTPMASETIVNGVAYNTATVTLADGQFFTLAGYMYAPGGVVSAAWYRADAAVYSDAGTTSAANNATIQQWNEFNGLGTNISQATVANRPVYSNSTTLTNFNPTVTFDGSNDILLYQPSTNGNVNILDRSKGALFSAGNITGIATMLGFGPASDDPGLYSFSGTNNLLLYPIVGEYDAISTGSTTGHYIGGGTWENGAGVAGNNSVLLSLRGNHQVFNTNIQNVLLDATRNDLRVGGDTDYARLNGQQNEVIIFPNKLTDDEVTKVESYLAVKYGQTLSSTQNRNYLSATGNVIWDGTNNSAYYNNIIGIGRENVSALNQKQSRSVNANQKLIIGAGSTLANTNAANTNTLTDGQFLLVGDNNLAQSLTTPLAYTGGSNGDVNYRFASIWKVQNTNSVGTVTVAWPKSINNLYLVQSTTDVFDATSTFTSMASETTVNGVVYNTATVTLADGQYFTLAGFIYAPGGVTSAAWYRADAAVYSDAGSTLATDNAAAQQWNEFNNKPLPLIQATAAQKPTFSNQTTLANFNPTVTFISAGHGTGQGGFMAVDPGAGNEIINRTQGSIYTAGKMNTLGAAGLAGFNVDMNYPGLHISNDATKDKLLFFSGGTYNTLSTNLFAAQKPFVAGSSWLNGGGTPTTNALTKVWLDGNENIYNNTSSNINTGNTLRIFRIGRDTDWGSHDGQLNEAIIFENPLSASEKARVDSYLAVKWGTTLVGDYVSSGSTVVWNTSATYQHNIFGVARDNFSALYQKQSRSENVGQKLIIGAGNTLANTNAANTNTLTNGQFLLVGDNNLAQSLITPLAYTGGSNGEVNHRFESIWKVKNTNSVGQVTVAWPKGINNLYLVQSTDENFTSGDTFTSMAVETTVNGVVYNTATVTLADGQYFTFAGFVQNYCVTGCNPNTFVNSVDPNTIEYDNIVSTYHATVTKENGGTFKVWGQHSAPNGTGDLLSPTAVTPANGFNYTGTPLRATGTMNSATGIPHQYALLTTSGLYVWGTTNTLISSSVKNTTAFGAITVNGKADGLPAGVLPGQVKMMFGSYGTLAITTCSGEAWVLSFNGSKNGDGTPQDATNNVIWHRVKTSSTTDLTDVVAMRGTYNALFALTSGGKLYTWGTGTYINSGASASRTYATEVSVPSGAIPKMIGMTDGQTSTSQSYYLLATDGKLYAMGNNINKQLGDGTTTERTTWVQPQKITNQSGQGIGVLENIAWISPNEHSFNSGVTSAINVLTKDRKLWAWGSNSRYMIGGPILDANHDPIYMPGSSTATNGMKVTDEIIAVETSGHTTINIKKGSDNFGYVGHRESGSLGDGSAANEIIPTYTYNTAALVICGAESGPAVQDLTICNGTTANLNNANLQAIPSEVEWHATNDASSPVIADVTAVSAGTYYAFYTVASGKQRIAGSAATVTEVVCCSTGDCNPNTFVNSSDPNTLEYDNIVSAYHSTIVKESDGSFKVWGQNTHPNGTGDLYSPTAVTPANGFNYTGTPLKATGATYIPSATANHQHALLTTDGLYVWGVAHTLISSAIKSTTAFGKITINGKADGLPPGVLPGQVKMMFGAYGTLAITTCSGDAWVLSFVGSKNGDGTTQNSGTPNSNIVWHRVKTSAVGNPDLTNVVAMRGTANALFALTSNGKLYTWGTNTLINDGAAASNRTYATEVSVPAGVTPKMIGMTQQYDPGILQSYYLLATNGKLYAMGENSSRQLGDGTTTNRTNWVQPQKMTDQYGQGTGPLENIVWISPNEHEGNYIPAINVLTNDRKQWAWGLNAFHMLGMPNPSTTPYDPVYMPGNSAAANGMKLTDNIIAVETGGHTSMNIKEGSDKFGYVGHYVNGSMGNGSSGEAGVNAYTYNTGIVTVCAAESGPAVQNLTICNGTTANLNNANLQAIPSEVEWHATNDASSPVIADVTAVSAGTYYAFYTVASGKQRVAGSAATVTEVVCCTTGDCNPNTFVNSVDPNTIEYDNFVSTYHSTIAKGDDGSFKIWGKTTNPNGIDNFLSPTAITPANGFNYIGTPLRATGGSYNDGLAQFVLLTTDGLYVWGTTNTLVSSTIKNTTAFGKITVNGKTDGLPPGVIPGQVKMMFGSYQTLAIVTCSGEAWVLSMNGAKNGDGTSDGANNNEIWHRVKTSAAGNPTLDNVVAIRGNTKALHALTSNGKLYTWGTGTFIGDGSNAATRAYATEVSVPAGITPKMIGATSFNAQTYYLLATNGELYSMGDNAGWFIGDGTNITRTTWVQPQKVASQGQGVGPLDNIAWISANEHDGFAYASVNVLTNDRKLWGWGYDFHGNATFDPTYMPGNSTAADGMQLTDEIIAVETGGHAYLNIKKGSDKLGYLGHRIDGSMGDGSTANEYLTAYTYNTVAIALCGAPTSVGCYKPGITTGTALETKVGISALGRGAEDVDNWPMTRKGGWIALEAKTKGFVPNRVDFDASGNPVGIAPADFVEGMMVYDSTNDCMKVYTLKEGDPSMAWHCISTQTCPD